MKRKYVPSTYKQQLYVQLSSLVQGNKSVSDYIQEQEKLTVLCDVNESEELRVRKFIAGLREDIRRKLLLTPNLTVHTTGSFAIDLEKTCH